MAVPMPDLCTPWDLDWDTAVASCAGVDTSPLEDTPDEARVRFLDGASRWLWWRTGRRYGACPTEITTAYRSACWCRPRRCSCARDRLDLSMYGPVLDVESVTVAGDPLVADTGYTLVGSALVRLPAGTAWPSTGDIVIEFTYGEDPPADLLEAAGILAVNDALACLGAACWLPERTKSISVEGMSIDVNNPDTWTRDGLTGIRRVDRVLARWPYPPVLPAGGCDPAAAGSRFDRVAW